MSREDHGNTYAREGVDRCPCGCKYWENDQCIDCGTSIGEATDGECYSPDWNPDSIERASGMLYASEYFDVTNTAEYLDSPASYLFEL